MTRFIDEFVAAWNSGDFGTVAEHYDPDVVLRMDGDWPEPGPYVGREAVLRWYAQLRDTWDTQELEVIGLTEAGDRMVIRQRLRAHGHGPATTLEFTGIPMVRNDKVILIELFWDHDAALAAIGLAV